MISNGTSFALRCQLERRETGAMFEFAAFGLPLAEALADSLPLLPGAVRHNSDSRPALLYIARALWLVCAPDADLAAWIDAAVEAGKGAVFDVEGKWHEFELRGADAARLLASTIDVETVLNARACAAVTLFDCPSILARLSDGFTIWVRASYAAHFATIAARLTA